MPALGLLNRSIIIIINIYFALIWTREALFGPRTIFAENSLSRAEPAAIFASSHEHKLEHEEVAFSETAAKRKVVPDKQVRPA